ncbi:N4-gp56 family major capsid protein [Vibrio cholerae]|nr:N4-gp56 family major capsid protein [Vibrio cholerae]
MATTTFGDVSPRVGIYSVAQMLKHAEPILVLSKFAQTEPVPKNKGLQVKFRRMVPFTVNTTPLVEGVRPDAQKIKVEDVAVSLQQYGAWAEITDVIQDIHEDPILQKAVLLSGEQAAETAEMIAWGVIKAGTSVIYANGTQRNQVNTKLTLPKIRMAVRRLNKNRARKKTNVLASSVNYGTKSVEASYIAVCHTDLEPDIRDLPGFKTVADYGGRKTIVPEEFGSVEATRFITTPLLEPFKDAGGAAGGNVLSTTGTNADVYPVVIFGQDAYGMCPLKGMESATILVRNPGKPEKGDELGQTGSVGWKMWTAVIRLNEAWMTRIEVAATAL